jgi:hypothetical protein
VTVKVGRAAVGLLGAAAAVLVVLVSPAGGGHALAVVGRCALPSSAPLWIEYGDGLTTDVRGVFAQPGVIVSTSGTGGPAYYRAHGALTTYFELHLPDLVGQPSAPADPASIAAAASKLLALATASTGCSTPWIALNELFGSNLAAPWSATNTVYRANVLALMQQLAAGGAHPVLLVHGNYTVAGATADWWRQVAQSGDIVYEAYYDASHISALGPLMGNRRMRLGLRHLVSDFGAIGITPAHLGAMLGFHTAVVPGIGGREGLQPREAWLRVVKWEALAARQVASETGLGSIWSWGWANFSGSDPDKAAAACVYLWARNQSLCDGPAAASPAFNSSLVEGQIVLPKGTQCSLADNRISVKAVRQLTALTGDPHQALTALFARDALLTLAPMSLGQVLVAEEEVIARAFHNNRAAYLKALARRHATLAIARDIIRDGYRRGAIERQLTRNASTETVLQWTDDRESALANSLTCVHDNLPGTGTFPSSDALDIGVVPLPALLPFLTDRAIAPPAPPAQPTTTVAPGQIAITWPYGSETELAGYELFRATDPSGPYQRIGSSTLLSRPDYIDTTAPPGQPSYYIVRAVDTSGKPSPPSATASARPAVWGHRPWIGITSAAGDLPASVQQGFSPKGTGS